MEKGTFRAQCETRWSNRGLTSTALWPGFAARLDAEFDRLVGLLWQLYGDRPDFGFQVEDLIAGLFDAYSARPDRLKARDQARSPESGWFLAGNQVGAVGYVDRFAGTFRGLEARLPYLKELGVTYLHLMPFFLAPEESDGGYAVSSYRETDPKLGAMADLEHLAQVCHEAGIVLVADFVFNHTSDEHDWARRARAGDPEHQAYYWMFDRQEDTAPWQAGLRDIFPEVRRGSFTWFDEPKKWVWTTFHPFQWDLNYTNPRVFAAMAGELVALANRGVGVLRLDAVAFVWKVRGTSCENRPEAHTLIQAFQAVARIVCPSLLFKSEAIVHPDDIVKYLDPRECQLSYNPLLMAELWEAAATKETRLLALSLARRHSLPPGTSWVNYLRCHDDIGWTFADEDAAELGMNGYDHRQFLNRFYTGDFPGTFARGVAFQFNPDTGDRRICGTAASLAGVERALAEDSSADLETALNRLTLMLTVTYTAGGIPLLYLGDEVLAPNRYDYLDDPTQAADSRWVHRPLWSDARAQLRHDPSTPEGRIFGLLVRLGHLRRDHRIFGTHSLTVVPTPHPSVLAFFKEEGATRLSLVGSFSEGPVTLEPATLAEVLGGRAGTDLITDRAVDPGQALVLPPCGLALVIAVAT